VTVEVTWKLWTAAHGAEVPKFAITKVIVKDGSTALGNITDPTLTMTELRGALRIPESVTKVTLDFRGEQRGSLGAKRLDLPADTNGKKADELVGVAAILREAMGPIVATNEAVIRLLLQDREAQKAAIQELREQAYAHIDESTSNAKGMIELMLAAQKESQAASMAAWNAQQAHTIELVQAHAGKAPVQGIDSMIGQAVMGFVAKHDAKDLMALARGHALPDGAKTATLLDMGADLLVMLGEKVGWVAEPLALDGAEGGDGD